jgi:hypothetical protein
VWRNRLIAPAAVATSAKKDKSPDVEETKEVVSARGRPVIERWCAPTDVVSGKMIDAAMVAGDDRTMRHGVATVALIRFASSVRRRVRRPEGLHYTEVKTL